MTIMLVFWRWYYGEAVKDVLTAWKNFVIFAREYFSVPLLLRTLFAPWRRDITKRPHGLDIKKFFQYLAYSAISRGLGFLVRFVTIIVGIIFLILTAVIGAVFFVLWLVLPFVLLALIIFAVILLV